jgi:hypothetical protein
LMKTSSFTRGEQEATSAGLRAPMPLGKQVSGGGAEGNGGGACGPSFGIPGNGGTNGEGGRVGGDGGGGGGGSGLGDGAGHGG